MTIYSSYIPDETNHDLDILLYIWFLNVHLLRAIGVPNNYSGMKMGISGKILSVY